MDGDGDGGGGGNEEYEGSGGKGRGRKTSPKEEFWMFFFIFGWWGPLCIILGLIKPDVGFLIGGIILTLFMWGLVGRGVLEDFIKEYKK